MKPYLVILEHIMSIKPFIVKKRFLCANALVQGETGLTFEGPFSWKSEFTPHLYRQGRFEPITISALSEKGLQYQSL